MLSVSLSLPLSASLNWIMITVPVIVYRSPPLCKHNIDAPHDTMFMHYFYDVVADDALVV